jgi:hypothetical protein
MDQGHALFDAIDERNCFEVTGVERRQGGPDEIQVSPKPRGEPPRVSRRLIGLSHAASGMSLSMGQ